MHLLERPIPPPPQAPGPEVQDRLVDGWSRQFMEHALFISLGTVADPALSLEASRQQARWEKFREGGTGGEQGRETALALAADLAVLKTSMLDRLEQGEWLGWLFPTFVRHMLQELLWFTATLDAWMNGKTERPETDLHSWLGFLEEHAQFAAHLLDPREVRLIRQARSIAGSLGGLRTSCGGAQRAMLDLSERAGKELDGYLVTSGIGTPKVKSVIHPVLAAHVVREGRMFLEIIARFRTQGS